VGSTNPSKEIVTVAGLLGKTSPSYGEVAETSICAVAGLTLKNEANITSRNVIALFLVKFIFSTVRFKFYLAIKKALALCKGLL
jgi:hypothetical protein